MITSELEQIQKAITFHNVRKDIIVMLFCNHHNLMNPAPNLTKRANFQMVQRSFISSYCHQMSSGINKTFEFI